MIRIFSALFAVALVAAWLFGLFSGNAAAWLTWVHAAAALWSAAIAIEFFPHPERPLQPALLGVVLVGAGFVAALTNVPAWQAWITIVFAAGYVGLSLGIDLLQRKRPPASVTPIRDVENDSSTRTG
jgi:hypothetical protein